MSEQPPVGDGLPIVVGIDGSKAALTAAHWAVDEAVARDVPLRLLCAVNTVRTRGDEQLSGPIADRGIAWLHDASAAIAALDEPVKIETDLVWGPPSNALIRASRTAAMVCIGTVGIGAVARAVLGSTATAVAGCAHCSVAVVRPRDGAHSYAERWVAVGIEDRPDADLVVRAALTQARLRGAPLVAVGLGCNAFGVNRADDTERRAAQWRSLCPDVTIDVFTTDDGLVRFLTENREDLSVQYAVPNEIGDVRSAPMAVIGEADVADVARIVGPHDHAMREHPQCSVLVAR